MHLLHRQLQQRTKNLLVTLGIGLLFLLNISLFSQTIPETLNVIGIMQDPPTQGSNLKIAGAANTIRFVRTSYKLKDSSIPVAVYVSRDVRTFSFGASNIRISPPFRIAAASPVEYRILEGKPSYCVSRTDGLWFLFVFPDEPIDVAGFIERFVECWSFFEVRTPKAPIQDLLPSLVGTLPGHK